MFFFFFLNCGAKISRNVYLKMHYFKRWTEILKATMWFIKFLKVFSNHYFLIAFFKIVNINGQRRAIVLKDLSSAHLGQVLWSRQHLWSSKIHLCAWISESSYWRRRKHGPSQCLGDSKVGSPEFCCNLHLLSHKSNPRPPATPHLGSVHRLCTIAQTPHLIHGHIFTNNISRGGIFFAKFLVFLCIYFGCTLL